MQVIRYLGSQGIDARPYQIVEHNFPPTIAFRKLPVIELVTGQTLYNLPLIIRWLEKLTSQSDLLRLALVWNRLHPGYHLTDYYPTRAQLF